MKNIFNKGSSKLLDLFINTLTQEFNFLLDEVLHIFYVINFFSLEQKTSQEKKQNGFFAHDLRAFFRHLKNMQRELGEDIIKLSEHWKSFTTLHKEKPDNEEKLVYFFENITKFIKTKNKLLEKINFLQKKIIGILNSFPFYYPSPKVSSIREASKIHLFIEYLSNDILEIFGEKSIPVYFYWDFEPEIKFLENEKSFIFNSNFFLPEKQSYWIFLFHEVFHFLLNKKERSFEVPQSIHSDSFGPLMENILRYTDRCIETLFFISPRTPQDFSREVIKDTFIDSILTHLFGKSFFIPAFTNLFLYDEGLFLYPEISRTWYVRINVASEFLSERDNSVKEAFDRLMEIYTNTQRKFVMPELYMRDRKLVITIHNFAENLISKHKKDLEDLKNSFISEDKKWLSTYLTIQKYVIDEKWKNPGMKEEGRLYCYGFYDRLFNLDLFEKNEKELGKKLKELKENLKVIEFKYIKTRFDGDSEKELRKESGIIEKLKEEIDAWGYGSYTGLIINKNIYQKFNRLQSESELENAINILKKLAEINNKTKINSSSPEYKEYKLVLKDIPFYKFDYILTLIEPIKNPKDQKETEEDYFEGGNSIYIIIKYSINLEKVKDFKKIKEMFDKFKEGLQNQIFKTSKTWNVDIVHFISFDWFDCATMILLKKTTKKNYKNNKEYFKLNEILKSLKCNILVDNENALLRTETDVFIGKEIAEYVEIEKPLIEVRVSSHLLGESKGFSEKIASILENPEVSFVFGIKDLVILPKKTYNFTKLLEKVEKIANEKCFSDIQFVVRTSSPCDAK